MTVLIVEDDLLTAEVVRDSINWEFFEINKVEIAHNVSGAKKIFAENVPDIVICDIEMPKGSGLDLLKWVRENNLKSEFIFLTNHESFDFASEALEYNAISYITKPFDIAKTEKAIAKAVDKIKKENMTQQFSEYGKYWLENKRVIVSDFWKELLFFGIPAKKSEILNEIKKRKLSVDSESLYRIVLISVLKSENKEFFWDEKTFEYAMIKFSSEIISGDLDFEHIIYYATERNYYVAIMLQDETEDSKIKEKCNEFIELYKKYFKYDAACYISENVPLDQLASKRMKLEEIDAENFVSRSRTFFEDDAELVNIPKQYSLDTAELIYLFEKGEKIKIVNFIKKELEDLASQNALDALAIYSIHHDFMQIVYAFLYKKEIQAHKLFSDKTSQKLNLKADNSVFDMLKWVQFVAFKTVDYVDEVKKSQSIIDKAKQYVNEHYKENITRNDVASSVFLTPEYFAKMFKAQTGITIKDFINQCRIEKAKDMLENTGASISEIAFEVGFDNFSYFSTVFKKLTGTSPQLFRKKDEK
jgi:two-component system response regulator YesN